MVLVVVIPGRVLVVLVVEDAEILIFETKTSFEASPF